MNNIEKLPKLDIVSPKELLKNKKIDEEFLSIYVTERDKVYNKLIDEVNRLNEENKRLREEYVMLQNASDEVEDELQQRIDKAEEYIEYLFALSDREYELADRENKILEILKGENNERK